MTWFLANWKLLAVAALLAAVFAFGYRSGCAAVQTDFDEWKVTAQESRLLADRAQRVEEQRKQTVADGEAKDAAQKLTQARADAARAAAARDGVQGQLAAYIAAVRRAGAQSDAPTGSARQSGADPLDLLAQLYSRSDGAAGTIADYADELAIRGASCERISDGLQPAAR